MEIKQISPMTVFYRSFQTTAKEMMQHVVTTPVEMYEEAIKENLEITGPQHWIYLGYDDKPYTKFTLEIAIPVAKAKDSNLLFKELPAFKCATLIHKGAWANLKLSYEKLMNEIAASGQKLDSTCREAYILVDSPDSEENITELQMGLQ